MDIGYVMSNITAGELCAREDALEKEAASLLGHMLFEFSRLDMSLGLCLVWVDSGARIESLTKTVETQNLKAKLDELASHVAAKFPLGSEQRNAYEIWIERVNTVRQQRNKLVHGRWGIEAHKNKVINVIGLPTSSAQQVVEFTLDELAEVNEGLRDLQRELTRLREHWPL